MVNLTVLTKVYKKLKRMQNKLKSKMSKKKLREERRKNRELLAKSINSGGNFEEYKIEIDQKLKEFEKKLREGYFELDQPIDEENERPAVR